MADDGLREATRPSPQELGTQRGALTAACGLSAHELEKGGHRGGWDRAWGRSGDVPGALSVLLGDAVDPDCPRLRSRGALLRLFT